jgi:kynureninase
VIFDSFGADYAYNCCHAFLVAGSGSIWGEEVDSGPMFTAAISGNVSQIDLALSWGGATV